MRPLLIALTAVAFVLAAPVKDASYERSIRPFLNEYCVQCHGTKVAMAERRFDTLGEDLSSVETQHRWKSIVDRLNLGAWAAYGLDWSTDYCSTSPDQPIGFDFSMPCLHQDLGFRYY